MQDVRLTAPNLTNTCDTIVLGEGTEVIIDEVGACRNVRNYPDPTTFNPRRWESNQTTSMDNFLPFGVGPRVCLGKKFSTVEAVCFLSNIIREWHFDVKLENGETRAQWVERVLQPSIAVTLKNGTQLTPIRNCMATLCPNVCRSLCLENIPLLVSRRQQ